MSCLFEPIHGMFPSLVCNLHPNCEGCTYNYTEGKKQTNADYIRSMTDEELADFLCHSVSNKTVNCSNCIAQEYCKMGRNGFIKWLKAEVKE